MDITNQSKTLAYCKHDGSLDDGFEIVTHPMSLDCQLHDLSWSSFVSAIKEPELVQYLKERNLYVNEPVEVEGEV